MCCGANIYLCDCVNLYLCDGPLHVPHLVFAPPHYIPDTNQLWKEILTDISLWLKPILTDTFPLNTLEPSTTPIISEITIGVGPAVVWLHLDDNKFFNPDYKKTKM